ncbi:aminoglycoside phosphotransferase family protein [Aspergillus homomorphus CBS 101889]|uniref:Altered inheritance of mitochondria protein 9, mitochondrial n=1 Tax=Aspergillus homomorphus (strain CBS 101889) TaxID=1450537 RepID=A0A395I4G9_ASPHC|nr:phosphotransferase enzyme family protein [Aspergillus homomorphus CBS 101889]RAL14078.1 phosphotransferase enzyme family protein [Aspergillus homomorphus CBS 101889]
MLSALSRSSAKAICSPWHHLPRSRRQMLSPCLSLRGSLKTKADYEDFFRYTSGRWLWDEEQQMRARYKVFNVAELQKAAAKAPGSDRCDSMAKLAEGGYNKVFRLQMNDGKIVLARIPNPNAGPPFYTIVSEVAAVQLVPVPKVYDWSATANNPVGSEYIIMEEVAGTQLDQVWKELTPDSKLAIMKEIVSIELRLSSISFSQYVPLLYMGASNFANDSVEGPVLAEITSDVPAELKEVVAEKFTIGSSLTGKFAKLKTIEDAPNASTAQRSPEAHIQFLRKFLDVAPYLVDVDKRFLRSFVWHGDLHSSNIFVDNNRIASVIDWQSVWAGPLFLQAKPSPLLDYSGEILLKRPANFDDLDDERKAEIKQQIFKSTLLQLYLIETEETNPDLAETFHLNHGKTRRLPLEYVGDTWDDDIVSFREALINFERHWAELGIKGDCPIHFTDAELRDHLRDSEGWNVVQDFFEKIDGLVQRDGWTSNETFDEAIRFFIDLRKTGLENAKGEKRERLEEETRWAE